MDNHEAPQFAPAQPTTTPTQSSAATPSKRQYIWGLMCLVGPTALIVVSILLYALVNFIISPTEPSAVRTMVEPQPPVPLHVFLNVGLFIVGAIATLTWLPGVIIGIILLATRKK